MKECFERHTSQMVAKVVTSSLVEDKLILTWEQIRVWDLGRSRLMEVLRDNSTWAQTVMDAHLTTTRHMIKMNSWSDRKETGLDGFQCFREKSNRLKINILDSNQCLPKDSRGKRVSKTNSKWTSMPMMTDLRGIEPRMLRSKLTRKRWSWLSNVDSKILIRDANSMAMPVSSSLKVMWMMTMDRGVTGTSLMINLWRKTKLSIGHRSCCSSPHHLLEGQNHLQEGNCRLSKTLMKSTEC